MINGGEYEFGQLDARPTNDRNIDQKDGHMDGFRLLRLLTLESDIKM